MKNPRFSFRLRLGLVTLLLGLIVIAIYSRTRGPTEPIYQGRALSSWIHDLEDFDVLSNRSGSEVAIHNIGTNALPFLIHELHARDFPYVDQIKRYWGRLRRVPYYSDSAIDRRYTALYGLAVLGTAAAPAIPAVAECLTNLNKGSLVMAERTLVKIGPASIPILEATMNNQGAHARNAAFNALADLHDTNIIPRLLIMLKAPDYGSRITAVDGLGQFPDRADILVPPLIDALDDPEDHVRISAMDSLVLMGHPGKVVLPKLLEWVDSTNDLESGRAPFAMIKLDSHWALAAFTNRLASTNVKTRRNFASALVCFGTNGAPAVPALITTLKDPDSQVRAIAAGTLGDIRATPDVVTPLLTAELSDPDPTVRVRAAYGLTQFGPAAKSAVPAILKSLDENNAANDKTPVENLLESLREIDPAAATDWEKAHRN